MTKIGTELKTFGNKVMRNRKLLVITIAAIALRLFSQEDSSLSLLRLSIECIIFLLLLSYSFSPSTTDSSYYFLLKKKNL